MQRGGEFWLPTTGLTTDSRFGSMHTVAYRKFPLYRSAEFLSVDPADDADDVSANITATSRSIST
jgi:hypothetical protein